MKQVLLPSRRHENRGLKQGGFYREASLIHQKGGVRSVIVSSALPYLRVVAVFKRHSLNQENKGVMICETNERSIFISLYSPDHYWFNGMFK